MPPQGRCEWNVNQRARLIQLVKQFDIIWLPVGATDKSKISASRRAAFEQIRQHFLEDGFTADDLASQWRNLKDIFYKRFKEMNRRIQMGEANVKPPWRFFDALSFLAGNKAMDANRGEMFDDSLNGGFDDDEIGMDDNLNNFGMLDELSGSTERSLLDLIKAVKEEQQDGIDEVQSQHATAREGDEEGHFYKRDGEEKDEEGVDGGRWTTPRGAQRQGTVVLHRGGEGSTENGSSSRGQTIGRRAKRLMSFGHNGTAGAKRAVVQQQRSAVPRRQLSPFSGDFRQHSATSAFGAFPSHVRCSSLLHKQQRHFVSTGPNSTDYFSSGTNIPSTSAETTKSHNSVHPPPAVGHGLRPKTESGGPAENDRFRYFGAFVESAVRDLFHQCPDLARRLLHSIYGMIAEHQMEATLIFGENEGPMDAQEILDDVGIDGEETTERTESHCWAP